MFPENDMLGIDYIIPDFQYVVDQLENGLVIHGIIVTHGHEDHTGAIGHVLDFINAPVYATALTAGLLNVKIRQAGHHDHPLKVFKAGDVLELGPFRVETFHVCHSIPDGVGLGITTPAGLIVHSGDFKFDHTPVDGKPPDFAKLAEFRGAACWRCCPTAPTPIAPAGRPPKRVIDAAFDAVFREAHGPDHRRDLRLADLAHPAGRRSPRSATTARWPWPGTACREVTMATRPGLSGSAHGPDRPPGRRPAKCRRDEVVIMATGTQGEPSAVLGRLATGASPPA